MGRVSFWLWAAMVPGWVPARTLLALAAVRLGKVLPVLKTFWWGNPLLPWVRTAQSTHFVLKSILTG